jgi:tetratricopeptide (TPR) repeat protein
MLNVPELERRWQRYRRLKRMPYFVAGAIGLLAIVGTFFVFSKLGSLSIESNISKQEAPKVSKATHTQPTTEQNNSAASEPLSDTASEKSAKTKHPEAKTKLAPSMNFMNDFESDVMDYYISDEQPQKTPAATAPAQPVQARPVSPQPTQPKSEPAPTQPRQAISSLPSIAPQTVTPTATPEQPAPAVKSNPVPSNVQTTPHTQGMVIERDDSMKDVQDVIARFKKNKNPALSLFVAKRYYSAGNYQQAYNYALMTNELNSNIEDAWLIFAKSLYKLGQKDMAIKTLKAYIQQSGSVKAKITLQHMQSGNMNE